MSVAFLPKASSSRFLASEPLDAEERALVHMAASLLLDYPNAERKANFERIRAACQNLPQVIREDFERFFEAIESMSDRELEAHFTSTFDLKRKCCPYLSYYSNGDTRNRGMALVRFVETYREAGWELEENELPDYLPLVLEFAAKSRTDASVELLAAHQDGIEVLRTALETFESPYAHVVAAVCRSLPEISEATRESYRSLVSQGPPTELVGLSFLGNLAPYSPSVAVNEGARV